MSDGLYLGGSFYWQIVTARGMVRKAGFFRNAILLPGINALLNTYFRTGTPPTTFHLGIINVDAYTGISSDDTMASHAGWTEITDYTAATRPQWSPNAAASGLLAAATACQFTATAAFAAKGLLVVTDSVKGGTDGVLWAHGLFDTEQQINATETLKCYYELLARSG